MKQSSLSPNFLRASIRVIAKSCAVAFLSLVLAFSQVRATILTWDGDTGTTGAQDGSGTWNTTNLNWYNPAAGADQKFTSVDSAVFGAGGTGAAVTLSTGLVAGSVSFGPFSGTYTLGTVGAGALTLNGDANYVPSSYISGQSGTGLGTVGLYVGTTAGTATINSALTVGSTQSWINNSANTLTVAGTTSLGSNTLTIAGTGNTTLSGGTNGTGALIINAGASSVIKLGAGGYSGGTTLNSGIADTNGSNTAFGTGAITFNGGSVQGSAGNRTLTNLMVIDSGGGTFTGGAKDTYNGNTTVQGTAPAVHFAGSLTTAFGGVWTLNSDLTIDGTGAGQSTFSGGFTVGGAVANANRTITGSRSTGVLQLGGVLSGTAAGQTLTLAGTSTNNRIDFISSGTNAPTLIINADPAAAFNFQGTTSTYSGTVIVTSGIADLGANLASIFGTGTLAMNGGTVRNITGTRNITGLTGITFGAGGGTFTSPAAAQSTIFSAPITVQSSATINFTNAQPYTFQTGAMTFNGDLTITGTHAATTNFSGGLNPNGATRTLTMNDTGATAFSGAFSGTAGTLVLAGSSTGGSFTSLTGSANAIQINSTTGGLYTFSGASTYTGGTTLTAGTLKLGAANTLPTTGVLALNGGTFNMQNFSQQVAGLNGTTGTTWTTTGNLTLTVGDSGNYTYAGNIAPTTASNIALTKIGTGTQILSGANTYSGATTIGTSAAGAATINLATTNGGTLNAAGAGALGSGTTVGTSAIVVNNGGTLLISNSATTDHVRNNATITLGTTGAGAGSVGGMLSIATTVNEGVAATKSGGTVTGTSLAGLGALTLASNSTLNFDSTGNSTLLVFNTFTPGGFILSITGYTNTNYNGTTNSGLATDDRLVFAQNQSGNLSSFDFGSGPGVGVSELLLDTGFYEVYGITAVPEPSTWVAGFLSVAALAYSQRRRLRGLLTSVGR